MSRGSVTLRGARVVLRPLGPGDAQAMFAGLADREGMRLTGTTQSYNAQDVAAHCARVVHAGDRQDYAICLGDTVIGEAILMDMSGTEAGFRIALWGHEFRDRGFGSEATTLLMTHAFETLSLTKVHLEVFAFNPRARHVYEKLGFREVWLREDALQWEGVATDLIGMELTPDRFAARQGR